MAESLEGTYTVPVRIPASDLSSLITVKPHIEYPLEWKPSASVLESAKKATKLYNDKHRKK